MKKSSVLFLVVLAFSLTSCVVTENVTFNADQSGKINYKFDMTKLMVMMGDKMGGSDAVTGKKSKDVDSTFTMASLYASKKDSIAKLPKAEQDKFKKMEKFTCHMVMKEKVGIFIYEMSSDFKNATELQQMESPVNTLSELSPNGKKAPSDVAPKNDGITQYSFDGKKFRKNVVVKSKTELKKEESKEKAATDSVANPMAQSMEMMFGESTYEMSVTFPKKIKNVSVANAKISEDKKTVTISYPMKDYMESNKLDFEVDLE